MITATIICEENDASFAASCDALPSVGDEVEFGDGQRTDMPEAVYYVRRVSWRYYRGSHVTLFPTIELTTQNPGTRR